MSTPNQRLSTVVARWAQAIHIYPTVDAYQGAILSCGSLVTSNGSSC